MNIKEKVFSALNASTDLTDLLFKDAKGQSIYHCRSPSAKKSNDYPIVVYTMTKDEPAVIADATVLERRVTIRISILTKNGVYEQIFKEIWKVMARLGFMFVQATETVESNDIFAKNIDFKIAVGVDE